MLLENIKEQELNEDSHVLHLWSPFNINVTKNYSFIPKGFIFRFCSFLLSCIAYPILYVFNRFIFGFHISGKENLKTISSGKITISNHIHAMDCTMAAIANFPDKTFFPTLTSNFGIPMVRHIIRLLHAIPIPEHLDAKIAFTRTIDSLLEKNETIHFYPEGSLWPYHSSIRHFKTGAFRFAVENNVPIVPMVFQLKSPTGYLKYIKKNPCIHLCILPPIYPDPNLSRKEAILVLQDQAYLSMKKTPLD